MVALPLRGELQHWKKVRGEGAVCRTNGYRLKHPSNIDIRKLRRKTLHVARELAPAGLRSGPITG